MNEAKGIGNKTEHSLISVHFEWYDRVLFSMVVSVHLLTIFEFFTKSTFKLTETTVLVIFVILTTILWSIFLILFVINQVKTINDKNEILLIENQKLVKSAGYKYSHAPLNIALAIVDELSRNLDSIPAGEKPDQNILSEFQLICLEIAIAFEKITCLENISVCIKLIDGKPGNKKSKLKRFVRDIRYSEKRKYELNNEDLKIINDTPCSHIINNFEKGGFSQRYYLCNDLPQEPYFKTANFLHYKQRDFELKLTPEKREDEWRLPYHSTLVSAIMANHGLKVGINSLIGFLCVDAEPKNAFDSKYDPDILTSVAGNLYNVIKKLQEKSK